MHFLDYWYHEIARCISCGKWVNQDYRGMWYENDNITDPWLCMFSDAGHLPVGGNSGD